MNDARRTDTLDMVKRWIRDQWGKHTEKKALAPQVRGMLVDLDGVYEQRNSGDPKPHTTPEQAIAETDQR